MRPGPEWDVIEPEVATVPGLFVGYACILALIPLAALIINHILFSRWALAPVIVIAIVSYFLSLLTVFITGFIINVLAPSFDGQANLVQAMKLAVYSYTAAWVAGVLNIVPFLGILGLLAGFYGLYILYLGLPKLMKTPETKTTGFFVITIVAVIVVNVIIGAIVGAITVMLTFGAIGVGALGANTGHGSDLAALAASSRSLAATSESLAAAGSGGASADKPVAAIDPVRMKSLLPDSVAGLPRTETASASVAPAGMAASNAEAVYSKDGARIELTITDVAAMGAMARMAGVLGVESDKQTQTGYEKVGKVDGRLTTEEWNRTSRSGKFGVLVADRVMIQADGTGVSMDDLKAAVSAVGVGRVEALARG